MSITKPTSVNKLKEIVIQYMINKSSVLTKVAPGSGTNGVAFGIAKVGQILQSDIAVLESQLFPESSYGVLLDELALREGVPARFSELNSSTYLLLMGSPGTTYYSATHTFTGSHGIVFELDNDYTIPPQGFCYAKVQSTTSGEAANVDPWTINTVLPSAPVGHSFVTNEYVAMGGQDVESDDLFRKRIRESVNLLATGTLAKYEQVLKYANERVLRLFSGGTNTSGKYLFYVAPIDGGSFSAGEFAAMETALDPFLSLPVQATGIVLENITFVPVDVSLRVEIDSSYDLEAVRKDIQIRMQRSLDYRKWEDGQLVQWDDLLVIAKRTKGVKQVLDQFFTPSVDIEIADGELPRIRSFSMYDLSGTIPYSTSTGDTPTNFPQQDDYIYQQTLIA